MKMADWTEQGEGKQIRKSWIQKIMDTEEKKWTKAGFLSNKLHFHIQSAAFPKPNMLLSCRLRF
jgi:hypothetical protein